MEDEDPSIEAIFPFCVDFENGVDSYFFWKDHYTTIFMKRLGTKIYFKREIDRNVALLMK